MRQYYLLVVLTIACHLSYGQAAPAVYEYDASGNRNFRKVDPLPVRLIFFTAEKSLDNQQLPSALLKWRTASETNSDHFEIQRSGDGKKWLAIGSVQASGDKASDSDYFFTDHAPLDGENLYRLKMVDRDETFAYSRIQSLDFRSLIVFYPNPVKGWLQIKGIPAGEAKTSKVQIWDAAGRLVQKSTGLPSGGVDMSLLPTGIYTVEVAHSNGSVTVRKVVKD